MASNDTTIQFWLKIGEKTCESKEEFNEFIDEKMIELNSQSDYICFIIDNGDDPDNSHKALLIRNNNNEPTIFFNSMDTFLKSKAGINDGIDRELATKSDHGLMSNFDYTLLRNLDSIFNIGESTSKIEENSNILNDIFEIIDKSKPNNKIYHIKEGKIDNFDKINENITEIAGDIKELSNFIGNSLQQNYTTLEEYINEKITNSVKNIIDGYINHTHPNN